MLLTKISLFLFIIHMHVTSIKLMGLLCLPGRWINRHERKLKELFPNDHGYHDWTKSRNDHDCQLPNYPIKVNANLIPMVVHERTPIMDQPKAHLEEKVR
jgi:hypothetical protein